MISLASKLFANLAVTFFCFAAVLSTCCCARHVKEDDRVFQLFVLQRDDNKYKIRTEMIQQ
jgi:hypothetical protein